MDHLIGMDSAVAAAATSLIAVRAYAFANTFRLRELQPHFAGARLDHGKDELTAAWPDGGVAIAFDFGAVVFFAVADAVRERVVRELRARTRESQPPHTEDYLVEVQPVPRFAEPRFAEIKFDRVVVTELSPSVRHIIALLLAQSAAMDYYEADVSEILARTERITRELGQRGQLSGLWGGLGSGRVGDVERFIGHCIQTKNEVVETLALFDKPAEAWEDEALDRLFTRLRRMLELDDRFRALEYRLRTIQDSLVLLVDLARGRSSYRLELLIVLLIVFEVALMLFQSF